MLLTLLERKGRGGLYVVERMDFIERAMWNVHSSHLLILPLEQIHCHPSIVAFNAEALLHDVLVDATLHGKLLDLQSSTDWPLKRQFPTACGICDSMSSRLGVPVADISAWTRKRYQSGRGNCMLRYEDSVIRDVGQRSSVFPVHLLQRSFW